MSAHSDGVARVFAALLRRHTGVSLQVARDMGAPASSYTDVAATDALLKDWRRAQGPGLDEETCTVVLRASAVAFPAHPRWLLIVTSGRHQGRWTVDEVAHGADLTGFYVLRCKKAAMSGTPTIASGFGSGNAGGFGT